MTDKLSSFEKIKIKGLKMALESGLDMLEPAVNKLIQQKASIELLEDEYDIVIILFSKDDTAYATIATIDHENKIKRQIMTAAVNELVELLLKLM